MNNFQFSNLNFQIKRGYTLVELIVAIGLFAMVMTLISGAYIMMMGITQRAQDMSTGIDNLSFALETMTRTIRTGSNYSCDGIGDCQSGGSSFSLKSSSGANINYTLSNGMIIKNGVALTDPSVNISSLKFFTTGTKTETLNDPQHWQPHVTIVISGTVSDGKTSQPFSVETGATMRGTDL